MAQVNMDFYIIRNRIHLFVQWDSLLYITVWTAISTQGNTFVVTKYRGMFAGNVLPVRLALIRPVCAEEFWPASAILRLAGGYLRINTSEYLDMMQNRKIWAEDMIPQFRFYLCQQIQNFVQIGL